MQAHLPITMKNDSLPFLRGRQGNAILITAIAIVLLVAVAGAGIDLGRQQLVHARIQQSADAAALAAGSLGDNTVAARYYTLNYSLTGDNSYMGVPMPAPTVTSGSDTVQVSATSQPIKNQFVTLGKTANAVAGSSTVSISDTAGGQQTDLIFVLDNSGSMQERDAGNGMSRMQAVQNASKIITGDLLGGNNPQGRISAVTWDSRVLKTLSWSADEGTVNGFIDAMTPGGSTDSSRGLDYGLNTFAPNYRPSAVHAVVFLTDGENNTYPGCTPGPPDYNQCVTDSDNASLKDCSIFQDPNGTKTIVYTIAFGNDVLTDQVARDFLSDCASDNPAGGKFFYIAPDADTLNAVFTSIITGLKTIRISQ